MIQVRSRKHDHLQLILAAKALDRKIKEEGSTQALEAEYDKIIKKIILEETNDPTLGVNYVVEFGFVKPPTYKKITFGENIMPNITKCLVKDWKENKDLMRMITSGDPINVLPNARGVPVILSYRNFKLETASVVENEDGSGTSIKSLLKYIENVPTQLMTLEGTFPADLYIYGVITIPDEYFVFSPTNGKFKTLDGELFSAVEDAVAWPIYNRVGDLCAKRGMTFRASYLKADAFRQGLDPLDMRSMLLMVGLDVCSKSQIIRSKNPSLMINELDQILEKHENNPNVTGINVYIGQFATAQNMIRIEYDPTPSAEVTVLDSRQALDNTGRLCMLHTVEPTVLRGVPIEKIYEPYSRYLTRNPGKEKQEKLNVQLTRNLDIRVLGETDTSQVVVNSEDVLLCPVCGQRLTQEGPEWVCTNLLCESELIRTLTRACRSHCLKLYPAMDDDLMIRLVKKKLVKSLPDIFKLTSQDIQIADNNFRCSQMASILAVLVHAMRKGRPLEMWINTFNIPGVSRIDARRISTYFGSFEEAAENKDELGFKAGIAGMKAYIDWWCSRGKKLVCQLYAMGMQIQPTNLKLKKKLVGKKIAPYLGLDSLLPRELSTVVRVHGGELVSLSFHKNSKDVIVVTNDNKSKELARRELATDNVMTIKEFRHLLI